MSNNVLELCNRRVMTEHFVAGKVGAPFGLNGFVKINTFSGEMEHLLKLKSVIVRKKGEERMLNIEESTPIPPALAIRFAGFTNPEEAKTLNGAELVLNRQEAAPLRPGEFYIEDLKGLKVLAANTENIIESNGAQTDILGTISAIIEGGGGDLAEIRLNNGNLKLVPFRKEFFPEINPEKGYIMMQNLWVLE